MYNDRSDNGFLKNISATTKVILVTNKLMSANANKWFWQMMK